MTLSSTFNYLQSLDYAYNILGWLTRVNDPTAGTYAVQSGDQLADLFSMGLDYESTANGAAAQYNGNIAAMQWRTYIGTTCGSRQLYRFTYDGANRLKTADQYFWDGSTWDSINNYSESGINYDLNGNITNYTRRGCRKTGLATNFGILGKTLEARSKPPILPPYTF